MRRLKIIVEGQTEETFVNQCLQPYLFKKTGTSDIRPILVLHSKKGVILHKGGIRRNNGYEYILKFIVKLIKEDRRAYFTTMFDLYAFPQDISNYRIVNTNADLYQKVRLLEEQFFNDVKNATEGFEDFFPYIQLHEFEALLFAKPEAYFNYLINKSQLGKIMEIYNSFSNPEYIDNGPNTAPSKRLNEIIPGYHKMKRVEGPNLTELITIEVLKSKCPHFNGWLQGLEAELIRRNY